MPGKALFTLENITAGYKGAPILSDVNLSILQGEWLTILGPNGSGKSTLLKTLIGVLNPLKGELTSPVRAFGYVPQALQCPKNFLLTAREYLALNPKSEEPLENNQWVKRLKLQSFLDKPLCHLSVGQFKRAQLVFALLSSPEVLFLDEYLEGLDSSSKQEAEGIMQDLNQAGKTIIEVSHDLTSVTKSSKRVLFVNGKISYDGEPSGQGFHSCLHEAYGKDAHLREEST